MPFKKEKIAKYWTSFCEDCDLQDFSVNNFGYNKKLYMTKSPKFVGFAILSVDKYQKFNLSVWSYVLLLCKNITKSEIVAKNSIS